MTLADSTQPPTAESPAKRAGMGLLLALVIGVAGAAAGFFAVSKNMIPLGTGGKVSPMAHTAAAPVPDVAFVEIPPLVITLPIGAQNTHLRFAGQIEVPTAYRGDVEFLMPRIQDVLNGYLRALRPDDIEGAGALYKIRLQLFRRIIMVVGLGKANALLVTEFVLK